LLKYNHEPIVIAPNEFPDFLAWPGSETVQVFEKNKENCTKILETEVIFTLDFNALHRVRNGKVLEKTLAPFIMIDHHQNPMITPLTFILTPRLDLHAKCYIISLLFLGQKKLLIKQSGHASIRYID
jgi:phosphoesterase RecJ-like protein